MKWGFYCVLLLDQQRNIVKLGLPLTFTASRPNNSYWEGIAYIPADYFPPRVQWFNAALQHGVGKDRQFYLLHVIPREKRGPEPSFHELEYYDTIEFWRYLPENKQATLSQVWLDAMGKNHGSRCNPASYFLFLFILSLFFI
ncbi:unnamed protein product [Darwinula stevensoni]|uniref:Uncharacterized protein n=1 Tax=Darwinula stevensoni TaxID=69355 RepID=A0A7R9A1Q9_9CRUS|nr:unnamed protein product [Darwinula stevensoni]CAG0884098.1 unnamed protein product [Darwinula stevensoni]